MNEHNGNGWRRVVPHRDFQRRRPETPKRERSPAESFLAGLVHGQLIRIDDLLASGNVDSARTLLNDWMEELKTGEWPKWLQ